MHVFIQLTLVISIVVYNIGSKKLIEDRFCLPKLLVRFVLFVFIWVNFISIALCDLFFVYCPEIKSWKVIQCISVGKDLNDTVKVIVVFILYQSFILLYKSVIWYFFGKFEINSSHGSFDEVQMDEQPGQSDFNIQPTCYIYPLQKWKRSRKIPELKNHCLRDIYFHFLSSQTMT